ncbi:MAG TPA: response regulator [Anaeromyxobacteraceae bacterium]|nr:response regulator [Anaeromyxobacteraceae bacterium]
MARDVRIGQILLRRGALDAQRLEAAERAARARKRSICSELLESGRCTESELVSALAEQLGFPGVDLGASVLELEALGPIPHRLAFSDKILAMSRADGRLHVATPTPKKTEAQLDELRFLAGRDVVIYVAVRTSLEGAIAAAYGARERGLKELRGANAPPRTSAPHLAVKDPSARAEQATRAPAPSAPRTPAPSTATAVVRRTPAADGAAPEVVSADDVEFLSEAELQPRTVLVVDDDEAVRALAVKALAARGLAAAAAADGDSALQLARRHHPDLVLLDAMLPNIHGFEVARRLRADPATRGVGVVIMSAAHRGWRYAEDAKQRFGVLDYIEKPFRVDDLQRRVLAALQRVPRRAAGASSSPGPDIAALVELAKVHYVAGELGGAIDAYGEAVRAAPASAEAQLGLGKALARRDPFRAMFALERAVEVKPTLFPALRALAVLYLEHGFSSKAAEALERAHKAAPDESQREAFRRELLRFG